MTSDCIWIRVSASIDESIVQADAGLVLDADEAIDEISAELGI